MWTLPTYFLWRNIEGDSSEVDTSEMVDAGDDEKYSRALREIRDIRTISRGLWSTAYLGSTLLQSAKSEDDRSLIFLDNLTTAKVSYMGK